MEAANAVISATNGLFDLFDRVELYVRRYVERKDLTQNNSKLHSLILEEHTRALTLVEEVEQQYKFDHLPARKYVIHNKLRGIRSQLHDNLTDLNSLADEIRHAKATSRVRKANEKLEKCRKDVDELHSFFSDVVIPALSENAEDIQTTPGTYTAGNNVPRNPPRLTLDYSTVQTCEGKLKAEILGGSGNGIVGVVASGLGGVGKTCALRGLGRDLQIKQSFPGGILYIQLGNDARTSDIVNGIANSVEETGGSHLVRQVKSSPTVFEAARIARKWFRPHKCLLLVDDIWWVNGISSENLRELRTMLHDESLLVYTTRDERFLRGAETKIAFEVREVRGAIARRMLLTHAGCDKDTELSDSNRKALSGILDKCSGLPLAIGIAGATVMEYRDQRPNGEKQDAWSIYYSRLKTNEKSFFKEEAEGYGALSSIVDRSLEVLDRSDGRNLSYMKTCKEMFSGFCVLKRQQKISGNMLQKLWGLGTVKEAEEIAEKFRKVSLVQMTVERETFFVQLHDLVLDIATQRASKDKKTYWYKTLVENYVQENLVTNPNRQANPTRNFDAMEEVVHASTDGTSRKEEAASSKGQKRISPVKLLRRIRFNQKKGQSSLERNVASLSIEQESNCESAFSVSIHHVPWWTFQDDGFIYDNLCRSLQGAGEFEELLWLLQRAQWIVMRLQRAGIHAVELDLGIGKDIISENESDREDVVRFFDTVGKASRMSNSAVSENPYEAWFQLYGRMIRQAESSKVTQTFVTEIKEHAPRPWVEPSVGFLTEPGEALSETVRLHGSEEILGLSCRKNEEGLIWILWRKWGGAEHVTQYDKLHGRTETFKLGSEAKHEDSYMSISQRSDCCTSGAFSEGSARLVTGYDRGKVLVWDMFDDCMMTHSTDCGERITCTGISGDGKTVVYGSYHGHLYVWDLSNKTEGGNRVASFATGRIIDHVSVSFDGNRFVCNSRFSKASELHVWDKQMDGFLVLPDEMKYCSLECVVISRDGKRVVCALWNGRIIVWNAVDVTFQERATLLQGTLTNPVMIRLALSGDGKTIFSATPVHQFISLWDAETGSKIGRVPTASGAVLLSVSGDGKELLVALRNDTVGVFHIESTKDFSPKQEPYATRVTSVAYCGHGSRVVTGYANGSVCVWDIQNNTNVMKWRRDGQVTCVAVSADGCHLVTGSQDGTLEVQTATGHWEPTVEAVLYKERDERIDCVAVNGDGTWMVFGSGSKVQVGDIAKRLVSCVTQDAHVPIDDVAISADGTRVAYVLKDFSLMLWNVDEWLAVGSPLRGHTDRIRSLAFSADGKRVASGSQDCTVLVWDVDTGQAIGKVFYHHSSVRHVELDEHGVNLVSYDQKGHGRLWTVGVTSRECAMTSNDARWHSRICQLGLARLHWRSLPELRSIRRKIDGEEKILASTDQGILPLLPLGDVYFSAFFDSRRRSRLRSSNAIGWPFCRIVR